MYQKASTIKTQKNDWGFIESTRNKESELQYECAQSHSLPLLLIYYYVFLSP